MNTHKRPFANYQKVITNCELQTANGNPVIITSKNVFTPKAGVNFFCHSQYISVSTR